MTLFMHLSYLILHCMQTTQLLIPILDFHGTNTDEIESSIVDKLQKIFKWLDVNRLCLNVAKSKFMFILHASKYNTNLTFDFNRVHIEQVNEFNFWGYSLIAILTGKLIYIWSVQRYRG